MNRPLNIALACQEAAGLHALRRVVERGHRVVSVFTDPSREHPSAPGALSLAHERGLAVRDAGLVRDPALADWLQEQEVDLLLNVHSLYVVAEAVVEAPTIGSFNLHPGPLPEFPGLNAPSWAIYEGATEFGCTVHWMNAAIDAGEIAYESRFPVTERDSGLSLAIRCAREGIALLERLLDDVERDPALVPRTPQRGVRVERRPGPPREGLVDWSARAERIDAFARACDYGPFPSPWGKPRVVIDDVTLGLARARNAESAVPDARPGEVLAVDGEELAVAAGEGTVLRVLRLERDGASVAPSSVARPGSRFSP